MRKFRRQKRRKECKVQDSRNLELGDEPGLEIANSGETLDKTVDDPDANKYDIKTPVTLIDLLDNDKEKVGEKVKAREGKMVLGILETRASLPDKIIKLVKISTIVLVICGNFEISICGQNSSVRELKLFPCL